MKNKTKFITVLSAVMLIVLCLLLLVRHASHSTDEAVRRRAVMVYYHTIGHSAEKRKAARYLLDNMPYHYGYGVTVQRSSRVNLHDWRVVRTSLPIVDSNKRTILYICLLDT